MASPAYKINDRRSSSGYSNNSLIAAATPSRQRQIVPRQDKDFHRNISTYGRQVLMSLGRQMFWNIPALQGALLEQVDLSVSTFIPQFYGADKAWGDTAESWLFEWHKIFDIAGPPYDYDSYLTSLVLCPLVDGDVGTLLTENEAGYPMIQVIPAHRIGTYPAPDNKVKGGEYDGATIIDGVIVNEYGRALAYRVFGDTGNVNEFTDISARDMFLTFTPMFPGQVRGISLLASSAFNFQDSAEFDRFELLAQKACAAIALIETNESGEADSAKSALSPITSTACDGTESTVYEQELSGGEYRYFKAGTGSKLETFHADRPSANAQSFQERKIRDAFRGTQWDAFFSLDPQAVGGAPMRVIVEKINRVLAKRRKPAAKACARVDGYGISKAIKRDELPFNVDWWKFEYQGPGDVTADRMYDSQVDLQEINAGIKTRKDASAKRGKYWEEEDAQREAEVDSDLTRAGRLAQKHGISKMEAMVCLRPPTPNQQLPQEQSAPSPKSKP